MPNCSWPCCICCVSEQHVAVVTKLGAYDRMHQAGGCYKLSCCFEGVQAYVSLQQRQTEISVSTKVHQSEISLTVKVQYRVIDDEESIKNSLFKLASPKQQIRAYVQDVLRSAVSDLTVEQVFDTKDDIAKVIFESLNGKMKEYGFEIIQTLLTDVNPPKSVQRSFDLNNLNKFKKEADKFQQMLNTSAKNTRSEAQKKRDEINGQGISQQRLEIVNGLKTSVDQFTDEISGVTPKDVLELVLITQYFDMLKDIGYTDDCNVIFTPGNGGGADEIRDAVLQANQK